MEDDGAFFSRPLDGIGGGPGHPLVAMDLFDQGADQGFPVQGHPVFGFDLGEEFGDMQRAFGLPEYV